MAEAGEKNPSGAGESVLRLEGINKSYPSADGKLTVLSDIALELTAGACVALLGPSGSGKSTLLHIAGLLDRPDAGSVTVLGEEATHLKDRARTRLRRTQIGFVYQFHHLLGELSAAENVAVPLRLQGVGAGQAEARGKELLERLGLGERASHRPGTLSGGERQRVAIARALAARPGIVLADEPTGNLDPQTSQTVADLLIALAREQGAGLLVATHDMALARQMDQSLHLAASHHLTPAT
jgi:lipoprotein-releasing system ATP-binding protein